MPSSLSDTIWSASDFSPAFDSVYYDSEYDEDTGAHSAVKITVDVQVPDEPIKDYVAIARDGGPICESLSQDPIDEPTTGITRPPNIISDKPKTFVGEWRVDTKGSSNCGGCSEKEEVDYIRHHMVASTSPALTRLLRAGKFEVLRDMKYQDKFVKKVLSSNQHLKQSANEVYKSEPERGFKFIYQYKLEFPEVQNLTHLTVFYFSELNAQDFVRDYNLKLSPLLQLTSKPISETIIENSKIKRKSVVYKNSSNGSLWNGPTNRNGSTSYAAKHVHKYEVDYSGTGTTLEACAPNGMCHNHKIINGVVQEAIGAAGPHKHSISDLAILKRISVTNAKVKDMTSVRRAKNININLSPLAEPQRIASKNADRYLPFFGLSCDPPEILPDGSNSSVARFYFDMNIEEILKKTEFGGIFNKNLTKCCHDRIIDLSKIISLEVRRRPIGDMSSREKLITNDLTELVAYSADGSDYSGRSPDQPSLYASYSFIEQTREVVIEPKKTGCDSRTEKIGVLKEVFMNYFLGLRSFSGVDYDFPKTGEYEYCVSARVRNGITLFLNEKLDDMIAMKKKLQKWYEFSSTGKYVDKHRNIFTKKYKDFIHCDPQGKVDKDVGDNPFLTIPDNAIILLVEVLSCLTNYEHVDKNELIDVLFASTNAETGNLDGIKNLIAIYDILIVELHKTLGSKRFQILNGIVIKNDTAYMNANENSNKAMKDIIEFEKCFKNLNCPCADSQTSFDFLGIGHDEFTGMKEISPESYAGRVELEYEKYFGESSAAASVGSDPTGLLSLGAGSSSTTLAAMSAGGGFSSFLTPQALRIGNAVHDLSKIDNDSNYYGDLYQQAQQAKTGRKIQKSMARVRAVPQDVDIPALDKNFVVVSDPEYYDDSDKDPSSSASGPTVDPASVLDDESFAIVDLDQESDGQQCMTGYENNDDLAALNNLLAGCPDPCGDEIIFLKDRITKPPSIDTMVDIETGVDISIGDSGTATLFSPGIEATSSSTSSSKPWVYAESMAGMPPQLLSLLAAPQIEVQLKTIPELRSMLLFNYETMVVVEALIYELSDNGLTKIWVPLTEQIRKSSEVNPVLCRIRKYTSKKWGMRECPEFDTGVCDSYFILGDTSNKKEYCPNVEDPVKKYLIEQQKVYRNVDASSVKSVNDFTTNSNSTLRLL